MSRKKLKIIIITLSVFFFTVSSTVNYINMYRIVRSDLREYPNNITDITEDILNRDDGLYEKLKASDVSVTDYMAFMADNCMGKMPHQTAVLDADGNILSVGGTAVFIDSVFAENKHCWLINLEEYMTSSLREEISHFIYFNSSADVKYFSFYRSEGKYIPVEMRLEDRTTKKEKSFYFTDNKADKTFNANLYNIGFNLWGERERFYEKGYYQMLNERLFNDAPYLQSRHTTTTAVQVTPIKIDGNFDYQLYVSVKVNTFIRTFTATFFVYIEIILIFLFAFFTAVFLYFSTKYLRKKEELEKSKRAFISAAAHELKTPLAVIQNQCECILEGAVEDKKDEYIKSVYDEALRMNDIVTSLLTFNRLSSTDNVEKEKCSLTDLVKTETEKYLPFARSAGAEITLDAKADITVSCNPRLMALAVDNYLSNAVKYTTGEKRITVTLKKERDSFSLEVFNTCEPLSKETAESIWNLFERKDISRTRDGSSTGMGLPICKRIFDCHGYSYGCKSTDNGMIFSVKGKI